MKIETRRSAELAEIAQAIGADGARPPDHDGLTAEAARKRHDGATPHRHSHHDLLP